jgi:hypothetical protein
MMRGENGERIILVKIGVMLELTNVKRINQTVRKPNSKR